ncbi:hypothetical protein FJT64_007014 [Amphibalanus amphitrite]|uniref:Protein sleepless n=1 Tax=Amphibalanus amphitrite TaxID=1232801 RepID=A0A6A4VG87_AMPAM|nr:hypothetical protein FJT64_007014 [Amphibalanus amphitrite]
MRRLFIIALSVIGCCQALKCYSCIGARDIEGIDLPSAMLSLMSGLPPCTQFDPDNPDPSFIQLCPLLVDKSCVKITDPNDGRNQIRSCFPLTKPDNCSKPFCYCPTDLCNGSERGWPSAVLLLSAAIAALLGAL